MWHLPLPKQQGAPLCAVKRDARLDGSHPLRKRRLILGVGTSYVRYTLRPSIRATTFTSTAEWRRGQVVGGQGVGTRPLVLGALVLDSGDVLRAGSYRGGETIDPRAAHHLQFMRVSVRLG